MGGAGRGGAGRGGAGRGGAGRGGAIQHNLLKVCEYLNRFDGRGVSLCGRWSTGWRVDPTAMVGHSVAEYSSPSRIK